MCIWLLYQNYKSQPCNFECPIQNIGHVQDIRYSQEGYIEQQQIILKVIIGIYFCSKCSNKKKKVSFCVFSEKVYVMYSLSHETLKFCKMLGDLF